MGLEPKRRDDLLCGGHVSLSSPVSARRQPDGIAELALKTASLPARQPAWQFGMVQTQVTAQGWRGATPPDPRLVRWGLARCCQLDPSHPAALVTREDPGVEPYLIPCG